jgi:hypothetical protein
VTAFPTHVTLDQMRAAAEALGLDPHNVSHFQADATSGVIVVTYERTANGKLPAAGDRAVSSAHHIPISYDQPEVEE